VELGAEFGKQLFSWFYFGHGFHQAWLEPGDDHPEWEIRAVLTLPIKPLQVRSKSVALYLLNEYSVDLSKGEGVRNEMAVGIKIPLSIRQLSLKAGWRHVDLIHRDDVDQFEGLLQVSF